MRDVLHAIATLLVIAIAAVCTMVQLADVDHALDRLRQDQSVVQQVDPGQTPDRTPGRTPGRGAGQE